MLGTGKQKEVSEVIRAMVARPLCTVLFVVVVAVTTPVSKQSRVALSRDLDHLTLPSAVPDAKAQLVKYEIMDSPDSPRAEARAVQGTSDSQGRSNTPDTPSGSEVNEAHFKYKLSSILKDLGVGTGSSGQDLARSGVLLELLEKVRTEGLAGQVMNLFRSGSPPIMNTVGGGEEGKDNGGGEEDAVNDDDPQGKANNGRVHAEVEK